MKTRCYSVRLKSLDRISTKAFKATSFDGSSDIIPASCVFGVDSEVVNSEAYWISAWILERKSVQYSSKKEGWFNECGERLPTYKIDIHIPRKKECIDNYITDLEL